MDLEEKRKFIVIAAQPWTDGAETVHCAGWNRDPLTREIQALYVSHTPPGNDGWMSRDGEIPVDTLLANYTPVTEGIKYAMGAVLDQTIGYMSTQDGWETWTWTTKHPKVSLFSMAELKEHPASLENPIYDFLEAVVDESEFRSREDTW